MARFLLCAPQLLQRILRLLTIFLALDKTQASQVVSSADPLISRAPPVGSLGGYQELMECPSVSGTVWKEFLQSLFELRSLAFTETQHFPDYCTLGLVQLIHTHTSRSLHVAFECPLALAAAHFSLAQHLATVHRLIRLPKAVIQLGFSYVQRNRGFRDCTPFPLHGWDMMLAGHHLRQRVAALDRQAFGVDLKVPKSMRLDIPIAIVSVCAYPENDMLRKLSMENHKWYGELHGYEVIHFHDNPLAGSNRSAFWWKVSALQRVMDLKANEWLLWMDCDAFFMDPERTIDSVILMYDPTTRPRKEKPCDNGDICSSERLSEELPEAAFNSTETGSERKHRKTSIPVHLLVAEDSTGDTLLV
eukprot:GHVT01071977.1.p1 GENE.GHVT01071977.1~~GHVT01071977.1.p1  ORF type:complete len:361 (-),score=14.50 GHVT01071977.1:1172-2254(-)